MPLRDPLAQIGRRIVDFFDRGGDAPFVVYQYDPHDEYPVRSELGQLRTWLEADTRRVTCVAISLAELFWDAIDESGWAEQLIAQESAANGDPAGLNEVHNAVAEILRLSPSLADRVVERLLNAGDRSAVFLYRAGALYPSYRTSTLLDELRNRVDRPVTLLYPGKLVGETGLSFMGRAEPTYGYRALIVARGA
ncbi:MAG: BREX protein BrxB domain-containing protein [Acidimicrobiia bacterium]